MQTIDYQTYSRNYQFTLTRPVDGNVIAIMVVWNGRQFLREGVSSVLRALGEEDDILVVDNGSTDGSVDYLKQEFPEVAVLLTHENLGGAGGFNAGSFIALQSGKCQFLWLLDNDVIIEEDALTPLLDVMENDHQAAAAGSQICVLNDPNQVQEIGAYYTPWLGGLRTAYTGQQRISGTTSPFNVDYLAACSLLIRSSFATENLFLDFFIFYDDVEWGVRQNQLGRRLWAVPASVIRHNYSGLKPIIPWREYYRKRNRLVCLTLHRPKYGGYFGLWVSLVALNYRLCIHKIMGSKSFYFAYRQALNDYLSGRLGKRDLDDRISKQGMINLDASNVYLDISNTGDAAFIVNELNDQQASTNIYLPSNKHRLINRSRFHVSDYTSDISDPEGIADYALSLRTILMCRKIYLYTYDNGLKLIKYPTLIYFKYLISKTYAVGYSLIKSIPQLISGIRKYTD